MQTFFRMRRRRSAAHQKPLVLVIEDNGDLRELYATYFLLEGFRVDTASDGVIGLAHARDKRAVRAARPRSA